MENVASDPYCVKNDHCVGSSPFQSWVIFCTVGLDSSCQGSSFLGFSCLGFSCLVSYVSCMEMVSSS